MTIKLAFGKKIVMALFLVAFGFFLSGSSLSQAQQRTHTTQKGDTLWSICQKYYGDPALWPKLWQMNPFVTNPHLIKPGEVITLFEKEPVKKSEPPKVETPKVAQKPAEVKKKVPAGINLSPMTNLKTLGSLSLKEVEPWGRIFASNSNKVMLTKGDILFVDFGSRTDIKVGDEFNVARSSVMLTHPLTEKNLGYVIRILGRLVLKELTRKGLYRAELTDGFKDINIGDIVVPYEAVPECVEPVATPQDSRGIIVAAKDMLETVGQYAVVYLDRGSNHGIRRGSILELVNIQHVPDAAYKTEPAGEIVREFLKSSTGLEIYNKLFKKELLYEFVIGQMMVLDTRSDTSTAILLATKEDTRIGTFFRGLSWSETPEFLTAIFSCAEK